MLVVGAVEVLGRLEALVTAVAGDRLDPGQEFGEGGLVERLEGPGDGQVLAEDFHGIDADHQAGDVLHRRSHGRPGIRQVLTKPVEFGRLNPLIKDVPGTP